MIGSSLSFGVWAINVIKKPKLKNSLRLEKIEGEGTFLLSERGAIFLNNPICQKLLPFLDGKRTEEEIVNKLSNEIPEAYIFYALMELEQKGLIIEGEEVLDPNFALWCESLLIEPKDGNQRLQSTRVALRGLGALSCEDLRKNLARWQIQVAHDGDIEVIVTDDYLREELAEINQANLDKSRPWMLIKPVGTQLWIGPIFQPGKTGCWECLGQRLRNNRPSEGFILRRRDSLSPLTPPQVNLPGIQEIALTMATNEILKWILQGENQRLAGVMVSYDTLSLAIQNHVLVKRPQCPSCGYLKPKRPLPVILGSRQKKFTTDGGHRSITPEETLARYQHHISPLLGIVRSWEKLPSNCNGLAHIYTVKHHWASMFDDIYNWQKNVGGRSSGKGRTEAQGKASGLGEAIERYSGIFQGDEVRIKSSYEKLSNRAIHPNLCMNFSHTQYNNRGIWNLENPDSFQQVPEPFDEIREIEWTPVWSLTEQDFKYLPTAYCYFGYPKPPNPDCWANANGCAAGNTLEEAILQGFLELVERDSVALWWYNRLAKPRVDLESFDEPYFIAITNYYQSIGRELWVLDLTSDLNIPTFAAISRRRDRKIEDIIVGFGTHFDPKLAIQRALTEISQVLPAVLSANPDGTTRYAISAESHVLHWWKTATLENQPYLVPDSRVAPKCQSDYQIIWHDDFLADITYCQNLIEKKGMEMLVLDQTHPDIGLNVVRVIVPGLRNFWKRLGPGRLYDVPVEMGWLEKPLTEEEMNPIPLWM
ncbi:MAG TPA: adenylate cyclase [Cyanobacteria bacterium UBA11149]|nr:adenylate cyclase [Cyanobacteria bacterium UBA11367]HBE56986.1 adenylate cyclase [Cyanobacteria bacterium UBA11366]HBK63507.1 adenylate cyclase [Cyanobacteria bacterium UBA11166]HBR75971.1 adenylate cyclase [Cyanobacteria bacterium UBA11159]HBS72698.1 adenylate cyclase [Cyanobacteria bacterium UBA11153]HBW88941.1 adenylate cyclase [Cyanobacteria bacterium UBA11149]HCA95679.1 adenylate cyclase [Cyanobacteria bacterium UBA9226]